MFFFLNLLVIYFFLLFLCSCLVVELYFGKETVAPQALIPKSYKDLTKPILKELLRARSIEFKVNSRKDVLINLLLQSDANALGVDAAHDVGHGVCQAPEPPNCKYFYISRFVCATTCCTIYFYFFGILFANRGIKVII